KPQLVSNKKVQADGIRTPPALTLPLSPVPVYSATHSVSPAPTTPHASNISATKRNLVSASALNPTPARAAAAPPLVCTMSGRNGKTPAALISSFFVQN